MVRVRVTGLMLGLGGHGPKSTEPKDEQGSIRIKVKFG